MTLPLTPDELLTTAPGVRRRPDLTRSVPPTSRTSGTTAGATGRGSLGTVRHRDR